MARPRVFVSSTFYDLRYARVSLESFIKEMGYDSVLNERGNIPYGTDRLEEYCYQEINKVSMLVAIIGGRFGTEAKENPQRSISNMELKTAIDLGKQVYICIDAGVHAEYFTYQRNKTRDIEYSQVDNKKVYEFIEEVYSLPVNNQVFAFGEIPQLINYLKEQWAGLFESYLESKAQERLNSALNRIENTTKTLDKLVAVLQQDAQGNSQSTSASLADFDKIFIQYHPLFAELKSALRVNYRVFFTNFSEMTDWLKHARSGSDVSELDPIDDYYFEFTVILSKDKYYLKIAKLLFSVTGELMPMQPGNWEGEYLQISKINLPADDDDIPF